jgi:hypothetical protein
MIEDEKANPSELTAPPLGVMPKKFHDIKVMESRLFDLRGAITRYAEAGLKIDPEWVSEYNDLLDQISNTN